MPGCDRWTDSRDSSFDDSSKSKRKHSTESRSRSTKNSDSRKHCSALRQNPSSDDLSRSPSRSRSEKRSKSSPQGSSVDEDSRAKLSAFIKNKMASNLKTKKFDLNCASSSRFKLKNKIPVENPRPEERSRSNFGSANSSSHSSSPKTQALNPDKMYSRPTPNSLSRDKDSKKTERKMSSSDESSSSMEFKWNSSSEEDCESKLDAETPKYAKRRDIVTKKSKKEKKKSKSKRISPSNEPKKSKRKYVSSDSDSQSSDNPQPVKHSRSISLNTPSKIKTEYLSPEKSQKNHRLPCSSSSAELADAGGDKSIKSEPGEKSYISELKSWLKWEAQRKFVDGNTLKTFKIHKRDLNRDKILFTNALGGLGIRKSTFKYSGDPNNGLVHYSNGSNLSDS